MLTPAHTSTLHTHPLTRASGVLRRTQDAAAVLAQPNCADALRQFDVAAFAFDSRTPASFEAAVALMVRVAEASRHTLPCVLLATYDHLGISQVLDRRVKEVGMLNELNSVLDNRLVCLR